MLPELKTRAVDHLRKVLPEEVKEQVRDFMAKDPETWWAPWHFWWGMGIRNELRTGAGITDDLLPSGNWDDYYVEVVEEAVRQDGKEASLLGH